MESSSKVPVPAYLLRHTKPRIHRLSTFMRERAERTNATPPQASLLGIPGELRNRISRMVLVEQGSIAITATENHKQPGLLRTCRQLRSETKSIFEKENDFGLEVLDLRPSIPTKYGFHWSGPLITHGYFTNTLTPCKSWGGYMRCRSKSTCPNKHPEEEWDKRSHCEVFDNREEDNEKVGMVFHFSMTSALSDSVHGPHSRKRIALCPSEARFRFTQMEIWSKIMDEKVAAGERFGEALMAQMDLFS